MNMARHIPLEETPPIHSHQDNYQEEEDEYERDEKFSKTELYRERCEYYF
jgi:hypothetical protein